MEDGFADVAAAVLAAHDSGELGEALATGGFKGWANKLGKASGRKGKRLFMPLRIALTVCAAARLFMQPCFALSVGQPIQR